MQVEDTGGLLMKPVLTAVMVPLALLGACAGPELGQEPDLYYELPKPTPDVPTPPRDELTPASEVDPYYKREGARGAETFAGRWAVAIPTGPGVIVNVPDATCEAPVVIRQTGTDEITYTSSGGVSVVYEVMIFKFRNTLMTETGTAIAEWKSNDRFHLTPTDLGKAQPELMREYTRCPG